jgi:hypothetical protein
MNLDMNGPRLETYVDMRGTEDNGVNLFIKNRYGKELHQIKVGDFVHINVLQFSDYQKNAEESGNKVATTPWTELRQFEVISMTSVHPCGHYARDCDVILKERDRQFEQNDGNYWIFYSKGVPGTDMRTTNYLSKIGRVLDDEHIEYAKKYGEYERTVLILNVPMVRSDLMERSWELFVKYCFYNKTLGEGMLKTSMAFPDKDRDPEAEKENEVSAAAVLIGIIWGLIPEGTIGFTYLVLALFFSALVCVMENGWLIIIFITIIYWCSNASLKINRRY